MIGPILIIIGLYWLWVVWHGKAGAMWNAITGNSGFSVTLDDLANAVNPYLKGGGGGGGSSSSKSAGNIGAALQGGTPQEQVGSGNAGDSGSHMGIDTSGAIIQIDKAYGDMSGAEQDAANAYAHQMGG